MSNSVVKCVQLYVISKMMNFKDVLSVIILLASLWGTSFSHVHSWAWNNQYRTCQCLFCTHFFVIETSSYVIAFIKIFERFRWERIRSWKKWTSCIFLKFRMKKKQQIDTSLRISNDYSVHDQFSTEMTKNTNIYTHKDTVTTNSLQTRTNPVLHELQFTPRKKDVDNTHGQRTCNSRMTRLRLHWPALNHWTWKLTDMFAVTKTWAMEVYTLSFALSRETLEETRNWWLFSVIRWTFELERL